MASATIVTVTKMLEPLPEAVQEQVAEHLREYIANLQDELEWENLLERTKPQLKAAARRAKQEIAQGNAQPMDYERL